MSCGGSVCSLFSDTVSNGSTLNGSCLFFRSGNGGFLSLEMSLLFLTVVRFLFYELLCYNVCSLYPRTFLRVYHYHYNLLYVLCLWNVCEMYASFLVCDFHNVYNFHRCRGYFLRLLVFELLVVLVFKKKFRIFLSEVFLLFWLVFQSLYVLQKRCRIL